MSLRDWPIKRKLTAILVVISGLVLLLTSAAFAGYQYWSLRQTTRDALSVRGRIIAANSTASLAFSNEADARELLSALRADPHIVAAVLYDKVGHVFAAYPADVAGNAVPAAPGPDGYRFERGRLIGFQPVEEAGSQMLGRIEDQKDELQRHAADLERRVETRTHELQERNESLRRNAAELLAANTELDAFAYSVSHDLRAPLRSIDGFSQVLLEDYAAQLDEAGRESLHRVRAASQRMGTLIDDLLKLARVTRAEMRTEDVDLSGMARDIASELQRAAPERQVEFAIAAGLKARGDARLLRVALDNLLRNSWKYTAKRPGARVEFASVDANGGQAFAIRDNGAGFDMKYADKLFGVFQRLHSAAEFEGTGVGLATVRRIINRHGGRIWAEGAVDQGATFYFTL